MNVITSDRTSSIRWTLGELRNLQAEGHAIQACFGAGVDSTAMLCALKDAGIRPDLILFADVAGGVEDEGEKPETYQHARDMDEYLTAWGFPTVTWVKKLTKPDTPYNSLAGNCLDNATMPGLSFPSRKKSCSIKWKIGPQDQYLKGCKSGPNKRDPHPLWTRSQETGRKIIKLIGYDSGTADLRRSKKLKAEDKDFMYIYPLQLLGWARQECIDQIERHGLPVPIKSACYFCPMSKEWEMWWLAGHHPELFEKALRIEMTAMQGKHSRYVVGANGELIDDNGKVVEFGEGWMESVQGKDSFPSATTTVGLGCEVSWTQFGVINGIVDKHTFLVNREHLELYKEMADELHGGDDNALDARACGQVG